MYAHLHWRYFYYCELDAIVKAADSILVTEIKMRRVWTERFLMLKAER